MCIFNSIRFDSVIYDIKNFLSKILSHIQSNYFIQYVFIKIDTVCVFSFSTKYQIHSKWIKIHMIDWYVLLKILFQLENRMNSSTILMYINL